ncbi:MAG: hypothetical protein ACRDFB_05210 [Rhabdochlamydiaceae bacterium]
MKSKNSVTKADLKKSEKKARHEANVKVRADLYRKYPGEITNAREIQEWHNTLNALSRGAI